MPTQVFFKICDVTNYLNDTVRGNLQIISLYPKVTNKKQFHHQILPLACLEFKSNSDILSQIIYLHGSINFKGNILSMGGFKKKRFN